MPRDIQKDYQKLQDFIVDYSIADLLDHEIFNLHLSQKHKRYYSILAFAAEIEHQGFDPISEVDPNHDELLKTFNLYISESISELGSAFFVWLHGCYKAAEQVLRSSIENFFKAIGSTKFSDITQKKNAYEVVDMAGNHTFFQIHDNRKLYQVLKTQYGELCATVHTAEVNKMQEISALGYFPHFSAKDADRVKERFMVISQAYLSILSLMFPQVLKKMYFSNMDNILSSLPRSLRKRIFEENGKVNGDALKFLS